MTDKDMELMRKIIEEKKKKSASQTSGKRGTNNDSGVYPGKKK